MGKLIKYTIVAVLTILLTGCATHTIKPMQDANSTKEYDLLYAVVKQRTQKVKEFLEDDINPNIRSKSNKISALEIAIRNNDFDTTKLLLEYGANPLETVVNKKKLELPLLSLVASQKDDKILKLFLEKVKPNQVDNYYVLAGAILKNRANNLQLLLDNHFNIDAKNSTNMTVLMTSASQVNKADMTKILLENGADVNATNDKGNNALFEALVEKHNLKNIKYLLKYNIDLKHKNKLKATALDYVIIFDNDVEVLKELLKHNIKVPQKTIRDAISSKKFSIAKELINYTKIKDEQELYLRLRYAQYDAFNFLLDNGFRFKNIKLSNNNLAMFVVTNRYKELKEYIEVFGLDTFNFYFLPKKSQEMVLKILDEIIDSNTLKDKQKIKIAQQLDKALYYDRAYKWLKKTKNKHPRVSCLISTNAGKTDVNSCKKAIQSFLKSKTKNYGSLSWYYLLAKQYDKTLEYASKAIAHNQAYAYSNQGHVYLLKGDIKKAYKAYKNYFTYKKNVFALYGIRNDFNMLKKIYPSKKELFDKAYIYCKEMDIQSNSNY